VNRELANKTRQVIDDAEDILTNWKGSCDAMTWSPNEAPESTDQPFGNAVKTWTHAGLPCAVEPCSSHLSGYVLLPLGHVARRRSYQSVSNAVSVHGGLTYGENGWFGFDTAHGGDFWSIEELTRAGVEITDSIRRVIEIKQAYGYDDATSWTLERIVEEVNRLAEQLAALTVIPRPDACDITQAELDDVYFELDQLRAENTQLKQNRNR
jgi:hypothetical protein